MKPFSKSEAISIAVILSLITVVSLYNLRIAKRRGRDAQRKSDIGALANALNKYNDDFAVFPQGSDDGRIIACKGTEKEELVACEWGKDSFRDVNDPGYPPYIRSLPIDPNSSEGVTYFYLSNTKRFQILASLEGKTEDEYDEAIAARNISCGTKICNFGRSSGNTPLDRSIEKYENELLEESK